MFEITEETRNEAIRNMYDILAGRELTDENLGEAFDKAVEIVKKQFGM